MDRYTHSPMASIRYGDLMAEATAARLAADGKPVGSSPVGTAAAHFGALVAKVRTIRPVHRTLAAKGHATS